MKVFLTAEWRNVINLTYRVPAATLAPFLPKGLELDLFEGAAHVSLVAYEFLNTRVRGYRIPFHVDFPEINLRFYARHGLRRGVVFIRELVPKHCIAFIAKRFYNEPYAAYPMESSAESQDDGTKLIRHKIWKGKDAFEMEVVVGDALPPAEPDSAIHFLKEQDRGFGRGNNGDTLCYEMEHPEWTTSEVLTVYHTFDFGKLYGSEWEFLNDETPVYELFSPGSPVKVFSPSSLPSASSSPAGSS